MTADSKTTGPRRLGRGLAALVGTQPVPVAVGVQAAGSAPDANAKTSGDRSSGTIPNSGGSIEGLMRVGVGEIAPSPFQPRKVLSVNALEALAASIKRSGVMQPVIVRRSSSGGYELVAGERRWRAAQMAGLSSLPAIVREIDDETAAEWALVENIQREELNPMERAEALRQLSERFSMTHKEVAERVGLDRSTVANLIRLTELDEACRLLVSNGELSAGHGKALLMAPAGAREMLARRAAEESWSVRRLEREAVEAGERAARLGEGGRGDSPGESAGRAGPRVSHEVADLERRLGEHLGTRVRVRVGAKGAGRVEISFYALDHFDDVMSRIGFDASS